MRPERPLILAKERNDMTKPNLIFVMADQLRADFLSCYGCQCVDTPNIDSLADRGVRYDRAYSAHPVCVPARVSLLTGMDAIKTGVLDNGQFLRPDHGEMGVECWPETLSANGYYTVAIGKMHFYPWDLRLGFQYRSIAEDKRWIHIRDDYYHYLREAGLRKYHGNEHEGYYEHKGAILNRLPWEYSIDHFVGMEACRFIDRYGTEGPFAMMVGFPGPHCPYDPCPEFLDKVDPNAIPEPVPEVVSDTPLIRENNVRGNLGPWNGVDYGEFTMEQKHKIRVHYAASVSQIDYEVGEILGSLRRQGLLDNTAIIFSSDHGDYLGDHGLIGKGTYYESSIHVPMLVSVPWMEDFSVNEKMVCLTDVTATLLSFAGLVVPEHMDSTPLPGLGLPGSRPRERLICALQGGWMIDDGEWRLAKYSTGEALLFHRTKDPDEQHNLYMDAGYLEVRSRLEAELTQAVMASMRAAHHERRVYVRDLSQTTWFGREGWQRPYPRRVDDR
jgi:arylsulfatase A-like enzyme